MTSISGYKKTGYPVLKCFISTQVRYQKQVISHDENYMQELLQLCSQIPKLHSMNHLYQPAKCSTQHLFSAIDTQAELNLLGHMVQEAEQLCWQMDFLQKFILSLTQNWQLFSILSKWKRVIQQSEIYMASQI